MSERVIKAGVIGWPVEHSLSPIIHNYWLKKYGINGTYERIAVHPDRLGDELKRLADEGYAGVNVTIPHKERVLEFVDEIEKHAQAIGAVNTITFKDGKIYGDNSDVMGFHGLLVPAEAKDAKLLSHGHRNCAVVIGAGGAARAVIWELWRIKFLQEILIFNRTISRAEKIKNDFGGDRLKVCAWEELEEKISSADILVNATSLGMKGQSPLEINLENLPKSSYVVDIVYNPRETELLKQATKLGIKNIGGLDMLIWQAMLGFHQWFKWKENLELTPELRQLLIDELQKR